MPTKVAVVIPTHKTELNELEKISLAQCRKVLERYPLIFALPEGKDFQFLKSDDSVIRFPAQCFSDIKAYNNLMVSPFFYEAFKDFDYILIYELDAFVFRDELECFCSLGYDYIGAPWAAYLSWFWRSWKATSRVGNSGFCLRRVKAHYNLLTEHADLINSLKHLNNDVIYSRCGKRPDCDFHIAPYYVGIKFSTEMLNLRILKKNGGNPPFGCHAWNKYGTDFYIPLFKRYGYDLSSLKDKLGIVPDKLIWYDFFLRETKRRLLRRIKLGQSILRYLPTNRFASVRVIRHPDTMEILARLLLEDNSLADKIFLYDHDEEDLLLQDLPRKDLPHLLLTKDHESSSLIKALNKRELSYGKHVVSFWREYLIYCAKLFHNLGK